MNILQILKIVSSIATTATGLLSLFWPKSVYGFTGLIASGPRGITEIRAVLGGLFIGIGLAPFILQQSPLVYKTLGIMYLAIALVRLISMILDKSVVRSNVISWVVEIVLGIILVL